MKLSGELKEKLVGEIDYVVDKMSESTTGEEMLYYFSAIYGTIHRIFNLEYHSDLVFMHFVLFGLHQNFISRVQAAKQGTEGAVKLQGEQLEQLYNLTKELGQKIKDNKALDSTLKKLIILAYTTTGNGYYLYQKGVLKL